MQNIVDLSNLKDRVHVASVAQVSEASEARFASAPHSSKVPAGDQAWL